MKSTWWLSLIVSAWTLMTVMGCSSEQADEDVNIADTSQVEPCEPEVPDGIPTQIDFTTQIAPMIEQHRCSTNTCHGATGRSGGLDLSELNGDAIPSGIHGPLYVRCQPLESQLILKSHPLCEVPYGSTMPLEPPLLTESEAWLLYQWVNEGGQSAYSEGACP